MGVSSADLPDFTWAGNDETGIFHPAANVIGFSVNASEKMRIHSNGNVGLGTDGNPPKVKLDVRGQLNIQDGYGHCVIYFPNNLYFRSGDPLNYDPSMERMKINHNGTTQFFNSSGDEVFKINTSGRAFANSVQVTTSPFPDYVFNENYNLKKIDEVEEFIKVNRHLPDFPTACEIEENGLDLGEMDVKLVKKIEELTLYLIELKKENNSLKTRIEKLENKK